MKGFGKVYEEIKKARELKKSVKIVLNDNSVDAAVSASILKHGLESGVFGNENVTITSKDEYTDNTFSFKIGGSQKGILIVSDQYKQLIALKDYYTLDSYRILDSLKKNSGYKSIDLGSLELGLIPISIKQYITEEDKKIIEQIRTYVKKSGNFSNFKLHNLSINEIKEKFAEKISSVMNFTGADIRSNIVYSFIFSKEINKDIKNTIEQLNLEKKDFLINELNSIKEELRVCVYEQRMVVIDKKHYPNKELAEEFGEIVNKYTKMPTVVKYGDVGGVHFIINSIAKQEIIDELRDKYNIRLYDSNELKVGFSHEKRVSDILKTMNVMDYIRAEDRKYLSIDKKMTIDELKNSIESNSFLDQNIILHGYIIGDSQKMKNGDLLLELVSPLNKTNKIITRVRKGEGELKDIRGTRELVLSSEVVVIGNKDTFLCVDLLDRNSNLSDKLFGMDRVFIKDSNEVRQNYFARF